MTPSSFTKFQPRKGESTAPLGSGSQHIDMHSRSVIILRKDPLPCLQCPRWKERGGRKVGGGEEVTQMITYFVGKDTHICKGESRVCILVLTFPHGSGLGGQIKGPL